MTVLANATTESGVEVISPDMYRLSFKTAEKKYFDLKVREILLRCNTLLNKRVKEFQESNGGLQPGLIVSVPLNSQENKPMAEDAVAQLNKVGYKARYYEDENNRLIEVAI